MDLNFDNIPDSTELDEEWEQEFDWESFWSTLLPLLCALSGFAAVFALIYILEVNYPGSPFIFLVRGLARIVVVILQFLVGLIQVFFSGDSTIIERIPNIFNDEGFGLFLPPFVIGIFFARKIYRITSRSQMSRRAKEFLVILQIIIVAICILSQLSLEGW